MLTKTSFKFINKFEKFTLIFLSVCYSISNIILLDETLGCLSLTMIPNQRLQFPPYKPHFGGGGLWGIFWRRGSGTSDCRSLKSEAGWGRTGDKHRKKNKGSPSFHRREIFLCIFTNIPEVIRAISHLKETSRS